MFLTMELAFRITVDVVLLLINIFPVLQGDTNLWSSWWSYHGISAASESTPCVPGATVGHAFSMAHRSSRHSRGPDYWGLVNQEWALCSKGRFQSPVDVSPRTLLYDPNLRPLRLDQHRVDGHLMNTGNDITYQVDPKLDPPFLMSGGPLSYTYRVQYVKLHFGRVDQIGSEHTVNGRPFPLELQFLAYNQDIYQNFSQASKSAHGIAAIAVFGSIGEKTNTEFDVLVQASTQIMYKGHNLSLSGLSILHLIPETHDYMTYEGSLTQPSCHETVTWIIYNKPLHITKDELKTLRQLHEAPEGGPERLMENNFRPTMPLNRRTVRTNIAPKDIDAKCGIKKISFYEVNDRYRVT